MRDTYIFAPESRKSQCGFGFGSVSVSNICYRPGSVYVRLRFLPFLVGFGSVWCLEHSILIDILEGFLIYIYMLELVTGIGIWKH